jgi:ribosomal protein L21
MFAVFESGGKQHRVTEGEVLKLGGTRRAGISSNSIP